jgi:hypothetical protein
MGMGKCTGAVLTKKGKLATITIALSLHTGTGHCAGTPRR